MTRSAGVVGLLSICLCVAPASAAAQTCLGFPSFATGPINVTASAGVGTEWWGPGGEVHVGQRDGGLFGGAGGSMVRFVEEPKETRYGFGAVAGFERVTGAQLHWCPVVNVSFEQGDFVVRDADTRSKISGRVLGAGIAIAGEAQGLRSRSFSVAPFASARLTQLVTKEEFDDGFADEIDETGVVVTAGLGLRFRDAIQFTPLFSTSTFEGADLVFHFRASLALQMRAR